MSRLCTILFLAAVMFSAVHGQTTESRVQPQNSHRWGSLTLFNGLPSDTVRAIAQTSDGILWFGTDNGLARFDGRRVQTIQLSQDGPSSILALKADAGNSILIGTDNGAFHLSGDAATLINGTQGRRILSISTQNGRYLLAGDGSVLSLSENERGITATEQIAAVELNSARQKVNAFVIDGTTAYLGTDGAGLVTVTDGKHDARGSRPYFVNALVRDDDGTLWIGAAGGASGIGIFRSVNGKTPEPFDALTGDVSTIERNDAGIWAGTKRNGLFHIAKNGRVQQFSFENTSGTLRSNNIFTAFTDSGGVVWVGTDRGASRFDPASPLHRTLGDDLNSSFVRTFFKTKKGEIFAGTNRGLFRLDEDGWREIIAFSGKTIYSIAEDADGSLIAGGSSGMFDADGKEIAKGDVRGVAVLAGKIFFAVFGSGLFSLDDTGKPQSVFRHATITTVSTADGRLLIGTANDGIHSFNGRTGARETDITASGSSAVWKVIADGTGVLYICAEKGLFRFANGNSEGLIVDRDIRDAEIIEGEIIAASSNGGLIRLRRDGEYGQLSSILGTEHGLPSDKLFALIRHSGGMIAGTNRGTAELSAAAAAPKILPMRILSRRSHDPSELSSVIELDYPQNSILIEVTGLDSRTFPEEFRYIYILKDGDGNEIARLLTGEAQYSPGGLSPGNYSIEARAINRGLLISEPLTVRISIAKAPFPWTATALGVLLAIALIALAWAVIERMRIAARNRELRAARFDLANEAERERNRIARDLHDQTLADLRKLMMASDKFAPGNPEFRHEIEAVSTEIRRICEDLSPSVLENVGLVAALEFLLANSAGKYTFVAEEHLEDRLKLPLTVQLQIYRIAQEVLTNIARHAKAQNVSMKIDIDSERLLMLEIEDDGIGFDAENAPGTGRGIGNIRSRAHLINAEVKWETANRFVMTMPSGEN